MAGVIPLTATVTPAAWNVGPKMDAAAGTAFVSIPTLLDPDLAPSGHHIVPCFTPSAMESWIVAPSVTAYQEAKQAGPPIS